MTDDIANASDKKFCIDSIQKHFELFAQAPEIFGFDRGGYSQKNIRSAKKLGVKKRGYCAGWPGGMERIDEDVGKNKKRRCAG